MADHFTNLDAMWLAQLADDVRGGIVAITPEEFIKVEARLRLIARNLQSLDERNQVLSNNRSYEDGYAAAMRELRGRSNIEPQLVDDGPTSIFNHVEALRKQGKEVKRVPLGQRALEDKPHEFNAPLRRRKVEPAKPLDLDLTFLGKL